MRAANPFAESEKMLYPLWLEERFRFILGTARSAGTQMNDSQQIAIRIHSIMVRWRRLDSVRRYSKTGRPVSDHRRVLQG
jgi:hypothetical protein